MTTPDAARASEFEQGVMREIVETALEAHRTTQRNGIVAAIIKDGQVIARAENQVNAVPDPTRHAEMVAFGLAAQHLGSTDLSGCTLLSTLQPCEMCLAAMRFSGIDRVIYAARQGQVAEKYFAFPGLQMTDFMQAGPAFTQIGGIMEQDVLPLYVTGDE